MKQEDLKAIYSSHNEWLADKSKGARANLRAADLRGADLRGANLRGANLIGADLEGAIIFDTWRLTQ